jgi:DNA recombination protein RmuC
MTIQILYLIFGLAIGLVVGWLVGWLLGRKAPASALLGELRTQIETLRSDLSRANADRLNTETARATAEAQAKAADQRLNDQRRLHEEQFAAFKEEQARNLAQMREAFGNLSVEALAKLQPQFLTLANETLAKHAEGAKGDLTQRQEAIAALLKPMEEMLRTYQERLAQSETTQSKAIGDVQRLLQTLAEQSAGLSSETMQLRRVLSSNQARGTWGEETLRRVVEASGMSVHCDFVEQAQSDDKKPDMIVRLPGDRIIIVDSKVPDLDFLNALNESDETKRATALRQHAEKLRGTIKALADRDYPAQFPNSLDHVVLFLPAESLFSAALEGDHDLIIWAAQRRIMLATPASLIALLRSVSVSWQQHDQAVNAREIASAAEEMFSRVATFVKHFEGIRSGLAKATDAYNDAVGSYERSVRPQGERMLKLGSGSAGKQMPEVPVLGEGLRPLPADRV